MSVFEELFNSAILDVVVPDTSVHFPNQSSPDEWLTTVENQHVNRQQAFFDEQLESFLIIRISNPSEFPSSSAADPSCPPQALVSFLSHLQISLEATYISPHLASPPTARQQPLTKTTLAAPPRSDSVGRVRARAGGPGNPSIFPPPTPNPTPSTAETDRKYVQAEGTLLLASIWGQGQGGVGENVERFTLLWSQKHEVWVAVYRLAFIVSFVRLTTTEPLLCLTVSATLREKRLPKTTQAKHPFLQFLNTISDVPSLAASPISPSTQPQSQWQFPSQPSTSRAQTPNASPYTPTPTPQEDHIAGLEEVNLLSGLSAGPNFPCTGDGAVYLPSTRLGDSVRRSAFSLSPSPNGSPSQLQTPTSARSATPAASHPTLRKSFRKTLRTVSGFKVRMRTVFVPYVLLDGGGSGEGAEEEGDEEERARREGGNEERTVVLCVEVENSGESGEGVGFCMESVDVHIGGEGSRAHLIGWGEHFGIGRGGGGDGEGAGGVFPVRIGSMEQYNLLYAVSFLQNPDDVDAFSLMGDDQRKGRDREKSSELQRAVTIYINGKPFVQPGSGDGDEGLSSYPTRTFSSRWNCILDLSPQPHGAPAPSPQHDPTPHIKDALPEPASPFPMSQSQSQSQFQRLTPHTATLSNGNFAQAQERSLAMVGAGGKRYTIPGASGAVAARVVSFLGGRGSVGGGGGGGGGSVREASPKTPSSASTPPPLPSVTVQSAGLQPSPTTYGPPYSGGSTPRSSFGYDSPGPQDRGAQYSAGFPTPAYPAYPSRSAWSPAPLSHVPISSLQNGPGGPTVEIRRGVGPAAQSPGPLVVGAERMMQGGVDDEEGEPIVISVGLLPAPSVPFGSAKAEGATMGTTRIYPLHTFTLDIFVFNQSNWTRRFEVSYPDRRRRRKQDEGEGPAGRYSGAERKDWLRGLGDGDKPGIIPLENRVRIGPLRPLTCQSVRMDFLAVTPGVHSIDTLTLTDVVSGYTMNLRSVMDVVVHEALVV